MKKIMIVDDEILILEMIKEFLEKNGKYQVETFTSPDIALAQARKAEYNLIVSDIMMPIINGIDILKTIRKVNPKIKMLLMSAYENEYFIKKSKIYKADRYLEKPFNSLKELEQEISTLI